MEAQEARRLLEQERARLSSVRVELQHDHLDEEPEEEALGELSPIDQHQADVASEFFEREKDLSLLGRVQVELHEVDDALMRLERGTYGLCQTCGEPIDDDRLRAVPAARFCSEHEALWEGNTLRLLPPGRYPDEGELADDVVAREARGHFEYLPTEDEPAETIELGPEEASLHMSGTGAPRMAPAEIELAEANEADQDAEAARRASRAALEDLEEIESVMRDEEALDPPSRTGRGAAPPRRA